MAKSSNSSEKDVPDALLNRKKPDHLTPYLPLNWPQIINIYHCNPSQVKKNLEGGGAWRTPWTELFGSYLGDVTIIVYLFSVSLFNSLSKKKTGKLGIKIAVKKLNTCRDGWVKRNKPEIITQEDYPTMETAEKEDNKTAVLLFTYNCVMQQM